MKLRARLAILAVFFAAAICAPCLSAAPNWAVADAPESGPLSVNRVSGDNPQAGDRVEIYFLIPGLDEKARRALATIKSVDTSRFTIEIDESTRTGKVNMGDLVAPLGASQPGAMDPKAIPPPTKPVPPPEPAPKTEAQKKTEPPNSMPEAPASPGDGSSSGGYVGIVMQDVDAEQAKSLGVSPPVVLVVDVASGGPAEQGGILAGDLITSFNGEKPGNVAAIVEKVRQIPPSTKVPVTVARKSQGIELSLIVGARPKPVMRKVPEEHSTIQSAIDASNWGDVIMVKNGIYREQLRIRASAIEIRGESRDATLLRVPDGFSRKGDVLVTVEAGLGVILSNLTLEWPALGVGTPRPQQKVLDDDLIRVSKGGVRIEKCALVGRGEINGARAVSGSLTMTDCTFEQCFFAAIFVNAGTSGQLESCSVSRSVFSGVMIQDGAQASVSNCVVESSGQNGLYAYNAGTVAQFNGNKLSNNNSSGIRFSRGSTGLAVANECSGNASSGILVLDKGTAPEIRRNQCHSNPMHGIGVTDGASPLIQGNRCFKNRFSGIIAEGADTKPSILDNECDENGQWGIAIEKVCYPAQFQGNSARGNASGAITRNATFTN